MPLEGSKTEQNLKRSFSIQSRSITKYLLFGEKAKSDGYEFISRVFDQFAYEEVAHARTIYGNFLGRIKSTEENLKYSADSELVKTQKIYLEYENTARDEGFPDVAEYYRAIRVVTEDHYRQFSGLYEGLSTGTLYSRPIVRIWECINCGYLHEGKEAPLICPLCKFPQGWYRLKCDLY